MIVPLLGSWAALGCNRDDGHAQGALASAQGADAAAPHCHAAWPMPNVGGSNLPNGQGYDTSNPEVVLDRVTGLSWQRAVDPNPYNLKSAVDHCSGLTLAGHHDWRLPALIELASIADTSRMNPAADPVAFGDTPSLPFWSSQRDVTNTGLAWYLFFRNGGAYGGNDVVDPQRVRCVRGPASCGDAATNPYGIVGDSVRDSSTKLVWQREIDGNVYQWQDANAYCAALQSSEGNWRLPSLRELLTLVDFARVEPAIDTSAFPNTPSAFFWSSSPSSAPPGTAWGVNFTRGSSGAGLVGERANVRCVR